jgi:hypothetical protein
MPYGKEAKEALLKLVEGKCLTVHVYDTDRYGRSVGDLHAGGVFVQVRNYRIHIFFRIALMVEATSLGRRTAAYIFLPFTTCQLAFLLV